MLQRKQPASSAVNKGKVKSKTSKIQKRKPLFTRNSLKKMKTSSLQRHTKPSRSNSLQKSKHHHSEGMSSHRYKNKEQKQQYLRVKAVKHPLASETPPQINPATAGAASGPQKSPPSLLPPPNPATAEVAREFRKSPSPQKETT